jgi:hypothetical protein
MAGMTETHNLAETAKALVSVTPGVTETDVLAAPPQRRGQTLGSNR